MARSTTPRTTTRRGKTAATTAKPKRTAKPKAPKVEAPAPVATAAPTATPNPAPANRASTTRKPKTAAKRAAKAANTSTPARSVRAKAAAKPKAAKPKAAAKPRAKPAATTRTARARAAVGGAAAAVAAKLPDVKVPDLPEVTAKRVGIGAGIAAGIGAAFVLWRATRTDQPDYTVVEQEGDFEVREYPALTTASTTSRGPQSDARNRNFDVLAGYIFAKSRPGEKIPMTAPVLNSGSPTDGWKMQFIMPPGKARADLPPAPEGVTLESHPPRRVGAIRFDGSWTDELLERKTSELRSWLQLKGYPHEAKGEHAAYNSPMMPGPLRRNEILVTLSEG